MEGWKKALVAAGAAGGAAALLWYLLKEEAKETRATKATAGSPSSRGKKLRAEDATKEDVHQVLVDIVASQGAMKTHLKALTQEWLKKPMEFDQTYQRIAAVLPEDPLERAGLSMMDFDHLLTKYQNVPEVKENIEKLIGVANPGAAPERSGKQLSASQVVEVHGFMLEELNKLVEHLSGRNMKDYDNKATTLAAQAHVGAKVEQKYSATSEDIDRAVAEHAAFLETDRDFALVQSKLAQTMQRLMLTDP